VPWPAQLRDDVAGLVDDIGVVAEAALHDVGAEAAVEQVVAAVAGEGVGSALPVPLICGCRSGSRFSTSFSRSWLNRALTMSVPPPAASVTMSRPLSMK
jgi:hypothetical protein